MKIATIVKSNSHVDYVGRVLDRLETPDPPSPEHYRFGQFVAMPVGDSSPGSVGSLNSQDGNRAIGVIYNSQLINPDYDRLGPRLSSPVEMNAVFSPDLLNEQGVLIGVLLLGWSDYNGSSHQGIPRTVIPVNSEILTMSDDEVRRFHLGPDDKVALHYYPHVITHARQFAQHLLLALLDEVESINGPETHSEIELLRRTLNWQLVFQNKSL